jgi:isopentenyl diphosphate isomerase/L-lactate dehydrogenase-like FMN-dependent dehydrogenase
VLSDELETAMRLLGVTSLDQLKPDMVNTRMLDPIIMTSLSSFQLNTSKL